MSPFLEYPATKNSARFGILDSNFSIFQIIMSKPFTVYLERVSIDTTTEILTIIQLIYGVPSLLLMISCFILISSGKKYGNSFYRLVKFDLFTNICVYLNTWIAIRIEMHPSMVFILKAIEETVPGSLTIFKYIPYFFFHLHFWTAALLTTHRLSSILLVHSYERFWSAWYWKLLIFTTLIICSHLPRYLWDGWLYEVYIINGELICINFPVALHQGYNVVAFFSIVYAVLNLTIGLSAACMVTKKFEGFFSILHLEGRIVLFSCFSGVSFSKASVARKLTKISITYCAAYTSEMLWSVFNSANTYFDILPAFFVEFNTNLLVFASDLFTLSLPYILLVYDSNIKSDLFQTIKSSNTGTIAVLSN
ncbi:CRE-SRG-64 protein [Caenorhabditis remanei]|uniref:Serpentine receptor class gamma n=1 Tax=Caenorhabditis remanei TaxID=31234 RepID=E3MEC4_CAERE|nr:CRE-SRG-64 protein [Caenorhabditis remanei]